MKRRVGPLVLAGIVVATLSGCMQLLNGSPFATSGGKSSSLAPEGMASDRSGSGTEQGTGLKGGERDDNADFAAYLDYLRLAQPTQALLVDVSERYPIRIVDAASRSVPNALVTVKLGQTPVMSALTPANGRLYFHPKAFEPTKQATGDLTVTVTKGDMNLTRTLARDGKAPEAYTLSGERGVIAPKLDLCFVLDVTGSMGDELGRIQATIGDIAARIKSLPGAPTVRYGLVAYRDRGDDFITRKHDFTEDLAAFKQQLNTLAAVGGGDYPEALNPALSEAVTNLSWDDGEAVRLTFVVGDAPPKLDEAQDVPYTTSMKKALEKGIKIYPLAASGLDPLGEYVFRQLAQFTGGKFLFLTYGGETSHQVGPVQENNLDDLVVGIVKAELSHLE